MARGAAYVRHQLEGIISQMAGNPGQFARNPDVDFKRNRKISFAALVKMLLSFGGNSLNKGLYDHYMNSGIETPTSSAFVQQRAKLKPEAMRHLFDEFNKTFKDAKTYKNYRLLAADSTVLTYNGYKEDDTFMPKSCGDLNQFQLHALHDILNKTYVDAYIEPRLGNHEPRAAIAMAQRALTGENRIILCDRGYGGFNLFEHFNRIPSVEYIVRIKDELWKETAELPMANLDTTLHFNLRTSQYKEDRIAFATGKAKLVHDKRTRHGRTTSNWDFESPFDISIRIVRFEISDGSYETIATSLPRKQFPLSEIKKLYNLRWGIETSFRELKYAIGLINFHSKKREFIIQEVFAALAMYNFCQRIIQSVVIAQDAGRKWEYQANFTMGIHICRTYFRTGGIDLPDIDEDIGKYILPIRPGRSDIRKVKPKGPVFFLYRVA